MIYGIKKATAGGYPNGEELEYLWKLKRRRTPMTEELGKEGKSESGSQTEVKQVNGWVFTQWSELQCCVEFCYTVVMHFPLPLDLRGLKLTYSK